jgi:hypothetical protein
MISSGGQDRCYFFNGSFSTYSRRCPRWDPGEVGSASSQQVRRACCRSRVIGVRHTRFDTTRHFAKIRHHPDTDSRVIVVRQSLDMQGRDRAFSHEEVLPPDSQAWVNQGLRKKPRP